MGWSRIVHMIRLQGMGRVWKGVGVGNCLGLRVG